MKTRETWKSIRPPLRARCYDQAELHPNVSPGVDFANSTVSLMAVSGRRRNSSKSHVRFYQTR
jgi:hypothetical protein